MIVKGKVFRKFYVSLKRITIFRFLIKSSWNKKDLNDVTAALFSVSFSQLPAAKNTENGAAVTLIKSFLFRDNFSKKANNFEMKGRNLKLQR